MRTASVRVIESGNGFTNIAYSHIRSRALSTMLRSSPVAIFRQLLVCCLPTLSNSGVVGSDLLGVIAGVSSGPKAVGGRERIAGVKRFWLTRTETGALHQG